MSAGPVPARRKPRDVPADGAPPDITQHALLETAAKGPWGGPVYSYRGAELRCLPGGHVRGLLMDGHPLNGWTFGGPGTITPLVDRWLDTGQLPSYMRAVLQG